MAQQSDKLRLLRRIPDIQFGEEVSGYSKDQVDRVLANLAPLADEIDRLQARLQEADQRAASAEARLIEARSPAHASGADGGAPTPMPDFDETLRNTLVNAQRTADTLVRDAEDEAERLRSEAEFQTNALLVDARDQANEMTTEAVAQRERLLAEAAAERAKMLDDAREEAQGKVDSVEEELAEAHEGERASLLAQIAELQNLHSMLQADVSRFENHLDARRADVQKALDDLSAVLDDPDSLRSREALEPAEIGMVDSNDYPPIAVEVMALERLEAEAEQALQETERSVEAVSPDELETLAPVDSDQPVEPETDVESETEPVADAEAAPEPVVEPVAEEAHEVVYLTEAVADTVTAEQIQHPFAEGVADQPVMAANGGRPVTGEVAAPAIANGTAGDSPPPTGDPFLDELRRVTTEEPGIGDPITDFLEDDGTNRSGGWFGRRS